MRCKACNSIFTITDHEDELCPSCLPFTTEAYLEAIEEDYIFEEDLVDLEDYFEDDECT